MTEQERYGMQGYIARVEAGRAIAAGQPVDPTLPTVERNWATLQAGVDINNLGLDLDSTEPIYKTFHVFPDMTSGGSFDSSRRNPVPDFQVPPAYYVNNVPDSASRMAAFADGRSIEGVHHIGLSFANMTLQTLCSTSSTSRFAT